MRNRLKNILLSDYKKSRAETHENRVNFFKKRSETLNKYNEQFTVSGQINNIIFLNNGLSTNVEDTFNALQKIEHPTILIMGGLNSFEDYSLIIPFALDRIDTIIFTGIGKEQLQKKFEACDVEMFLADTLEEATYIAYRNAAENYVVLYSPTAEPLEFNNADERKEEFNKIVRKLLG